MKTIQIFILFLFSLNQIGNCQFILQFPNCRSVHVIEDHHDVIKGEIIFCLEQQISPSIWTKIFQKNNNSNFSGFHNLPDGTYRIIGTIEKKFHISAKKTSIIRRPNKKLSIFYSSPSFEIKDCKEQSQDEFRIQVFPNPVNDILSLEIALSKQLEGSPLNVEIYDINGIKVFSKTSLALKHNIKTGEWIPGLFVLKVENSTSKRNEVLRFVKQ